MAEKKDDTNKAFVAGVLVGSVLGLFSFIAIFGNEALKEHDFLAGAWTLGCMIAVGLIVKHA